jgi:hypothetical protein
VSRFDQPCPACGVSIRFSDRPRGATFPCPGCHVELKRDVIQAYVIWAASFVAAPILAWHFGYRGSMFVLAAGGILLSLLFLGIFVIASLPARGFKRVPPGDGKPFERVVSLHLTDQTDTDKKAKL